MPPIPDDESIIAQAKHAIKNRQIINAAPVKIWDKTSGRPYAGLLIDVRPKSLCITVFIEGKERQMDIDSIAQIDLISLEEVLKLINDHFYCIYPRRLS